MLEGEYKIEGQSNKRGGTKLKLFGKDRFEIFFKGIHAKKCKPRRSFCPYGMSKGKSNWTCAQYYDGFTLNAPENKDLLEIDSLGYVKVNGKPYYFEHQIECVDSLSTED